MKLQVLLCYNLNSVSPFYIISATFAMNCWKHAPVGFTMPIYLCAHIRELPNGF